MASSSPQITMSPNGAGSRTFLIGDDMNSGPLEPRLDERVVGVEVVIAEHGKLAQRGGNRRETRRDAFDVGTAHRHEIAAEKQYVGAHVRQGGAGSRRERGRPSSPRHGNPRRTRRGEPAEAGGSRRAAGLSVISDVRMSP